MRKVKFLDRLQVPSYVYLLNRSSIVIEGTRTKLDIFNCVLGEQEELEGSEKSERSERSERSLCIKL